MTASDINLFSSLADLSHQIASKVVSPVEVLAAQLERIARLDPYYGAFVVVDVDGAVQAARAAEEAIAKGGAIGPLHGVPIAVKDLFGTENLPTRCGSAIDEELLPQTDAAVVGNLRRAGAVILGKVATTEFALSGYHPSNRPPQNPWGKDRWVGVSSSGSGVAVAAGLAFGALGTDTGGSVRFPAAANGIVGLKPTYERLSRDGVFPLAPSLDHVGVFARRVGDAAILYRACAGETPAGADARGARSLRIGVNHSFVEENAAPEVVESVRRATEILSRLGHELVEVDFTLFAEFAPLWAPVTALEAWERHKALFARHADAYGPVFSNLLEEGKEISDAQRKELVEARAVLTRRFLALLETVDVLACPSAPAPAAPLAELPPQLVLPTEAVTQFVTFTAAANFSGAPTISAPCGRSSENMPLSLQLIGPRGGEQTIIDLMAAFESASDWASKIPTDPQA